MNVFPKKVQFNLGSQLKESGLSMPDNIVKGPVAGLSRVSKTFSIIYPIDIRDRLGVICLSKGDF